MQARKNIWPQILFAAGMEAATFICWMSKADPALTKRLLTLALAVDLYVVPKAYSFFYKAYKESKDFIDFNVKIGMPHATVEGLKIIRDRFCGKKA